MSDTETKPSDILQDKNIGEVFQIALINSKPEGRKPFNWSSFKPEAVKSAEDLPPYMIFGPLDRGTLIINSDGWHAVWSDPEQKAKVTVNWGAKTQRYTAQQFWQGEEGSAVEQQDSTPLIQVFALLYESGFPKNWDAKAKETVEEKYYLTWLEGSDRLPVYFGAPDGIFRTISFPLMVKNVRFAQKILQDIAKQKLSYAFFATATLMEQEVFYKIGTAPEWTSDLAMCLTQSIGETGLIPSNVPTIEKVDDAEWVNMRRDVMMLNISVPFAKIFDMLAMLSETPMPIISRSEAPIRRDLLPYIAPQGLSEKINTFTLDDTIQGIRVSYSYPAPDIDLDQLLQLDSNDQIDRLEKLSDALIDQINADIEQEIGGDKKIVTE